MFQKLENIISQPSQSQKRDGCGGLEAGVQDLIVTLGVIGKGGKNF